MVAQEARRAASHRKIVEAASRIFRQMGYHGTTVAEVMREAGMTVGGFYAHFRNKEDLFRAALQHAMNDSFDDLESHMTEDNGWERLCQMGSIYLSPEHFRLVDAGCPLPSLLSEVMRSSEEVQDAFTAMMRERLDQIASFFSEDEREQVRPLLQSVQCLAMGAMAQARASRNPEFVAEVLTNADRCAGLLVSTFAAKLEAGEDPLADMVREKGEFSLHPERAPSSN